MRVMCVAGARPNFMKVAPVVRELESRGVGVEIVHTGQHYDAAMSDVFFADLGLRAPDHHLGVGSGSQAEQVARVMTAFEALLADRRPDLVVVVGDVNSTMACALVTAKDSARLAHVEAGLRSRDWTMPEEVNRVVTDRVSDLLLAPSSDAVVNLEAEGVPRSSIHLVGNVMVDSLLMALERARAGTTLADHGLEPGGYGLVTLHRPANVDDIDVLAGLLATLGHVARRLPLILPAHPRTKAVLGRHEVPDGVRIIDPLGYLDFVACEAAARLVLTDSGGVQEETTVLGVPCLTLRDNTERPVTITDGTNRLVGRDPERILAAVEEVLVDPPRGRRPPLWDGRAAARIADVLVAEAPG
jgi:UDP-N-acetylglucosamine 2-epimerase (non-hydrolysing)